MASKDASGQEVSIGDIVMLARTAKSAGISWLTLRVARLTEKSFWSEEVNSRDGSYYEAGPFKLGNCIVIARGKAD